MSVYVNQVGYRRDAHKLAIMTGATACKLINEDNSTQVELTANYHGYDAASGDEVWKVDFSHIKESGTYHLEDNSGAVSPSFRIGCGIYGDAFYDMLRMFYYQRCGCGLDATHAGVFAHATCHTTLVADYENPDVMKEMNGGWHDAGDFGRYISPAAVTVGHLLYSYLLFPRAYDRSLNIPESGNGVPDILNECRYELDWMLKLQKEDGGVYHKVTTPYHAPFIMPEEDEQPLIAYPVSSMATADFVASMALASRIYRAFDTAYADKLLSAAKHSFAWLLAHPEHVGFENPKDCHTGDYRDVCDLDERLWAAAEMYLCTGDSDALSMLRSLVPSNIDKTGLGWANVAGFAGLCVLFAPEDSFDADTVAVFRNAFLDKAENLRTITATSGYTMSLRNNEFCWGSNLSVMTNACILLVATMISGDCSYAAAAEEHLHYLLGRNPLNISYVTGHGEHAFRNPHNRPTYADGVDDPIPGYVSGGPNVHPCDPKACADIPEGSPGMRCFTDAYESYSTNEIAIYWNSIAVLAFSYFVN